MVPCGSSPVGRLHLAKNEAPEEKAGSYVWIEKKFYPVFLCRGKSYPAYGMNIRA